LEGIKHKADLIQTQTPINPGNSGGPLIADSTALLGVNTFKNKSAEGLNFAVSVDDVKRFLSRAGDRLAQTEAPKPKKDCKPVQVSKSRNKQNDAVVIEYDFFCSGRVSADYVIPDKKTDAIMLMVDRNADGKPDVIYFDFKRQGKWDLSFWDEDFGGRWTLVGYHLDGSLNPTSFESYEAFQRRAANQ
jgi:Trypsin